MGGGPLEVVCDLQVFTRPMICTNFSSVHQTTRSAQIVASVTMVRANVGRVRLALLRDTAGNDYSCSYSDDRQCNEYLHTAPMKHMSCSVN